MVGTVETTNKSPVVAVASKSVIKDAPEIGDFYGRKLELSLLQQKILQGKCNLINLLGIRGIGKTTLALKLGLFQTKYDKLVGEIPI